MKIDTKRGSMGTRAHSSGVDAMRAAAMLIAPFVLLIAASGCSSGTSAQQDIVKVFKSDGSRQCESEGTSVETMAQELINAGIDVLCGQKGDDGLAHPTVCGGETGAINVYSIRAASQPDAESLGFAPVSDLSEYHDTPCG
ncbi:hypothetical protein E4T66_21125 [Sinimarinibacterium sp. CAU 1509]|uniref:hypothetical protein n=1 Tax=Sinimarinibacterium sp. CAU 1509 TaxID=2562283 RepID=UPI0010ACDB39|nr:hypothetical protein [Sinimarinibacterium sp. CAU 1509]TJY55176.1 hypothetical protein E4T66_21125 [Sinimarinibacterium sp. CAU 1509]